MSQVYDDENNLVPVTIIEAGPCPVLQVKTEDKDGYSAIQIGFNPQGKSPNKSNRCSKGHAKKAGVDSQQVAQEIRCDAEHEFEKGNVITVENFKDIKLVDVISKTKGKGFQGVVKRWNFAGGPASHGSMFHRRGGSYGLCQWPGRVFKNKKMPQNPDQSVTQVIEVNSETPDCIELTVGIAWGAVVLLWNFTISMSPLTQISKDKLQSPIQ